MENVNRGSEWRKWDLHIHSPLSFLENQYNKDWDGWKKALIEKKIKAIGLTNYFRFNIEDNKNEIDIVRDQLKDTDLIIFPNLEFRLAQPNKEGEFINIHIIFSDKITTERIEDFLKRLKTNNKYCSDLQKDDFLGATINHETLIQQLNDDFPGKKEYLIICCPNGYGGFRQDNREGRSVEVATQFDKLADFFFGRAKDTDYFLNNKRFEGAKAKAVVFCSDAHSIEQIDSESFTWIKADVSFEGLRQIIYEPDQRVSIQALKPEEKAGYQTIDFVKISHADFFPQTIYLNENLNSIIGGRSTGKSILLGSIAKKLRSSMKLNMIMRYTGIM